MTLSLGVFLWVLTVGGFFAFGASPLGSGKATFALAYLSFLEALTIVYVAAPFLPLVRRHFVAALYPVFGLILGAYVLRALLMMFVTHTVPFLDSPRTHLASVLVGLVPFLVITAVLFVLNVWQNERSEVAHAERKSLSARRAEMSAIYDQFQGYRGSISDSLYMSAEPTMKKLSERFSFCTPFHEERPSADGIDEEVFRAMADLRESVHSLLNASPEEQSPGVEKLRHDASSLLKLLARREQLQIK